MSGCAKAQTLLFGFSSGFCHSCFDAVFKSDDKTAGEFFVQSYSELIGFFKGV